MEDYQKRCSIICGSGKSCLNWALKGRYACAVHERCSSTTTAGKRCKFLSRVNDDYCGIHQSSKVASGGNSRSTNTTKGYGIRSWLSSWW